MSEVTEKKNVLQKIVEHKRTEIEQYKKEFPAKLFIAGLTKSEKSLFESLAKDKAGFIFECKKASPSKGLIREHFDLEEILKAYVPHAAGISVLTDEKYFQGSYDYLDYVTQHAVQPVLNKDFFIDEYQVHLARKYNADAILLMLSVLSDEEYKRLASLAEEYGLDILTEVSNEEETLRAIALKAKIIGINNRNLRDLSTDLATTEKLVPLIEERANHEYVIISESGIYTNEDVRRLAPKVNGFLVGSSLMAQDDLPKAVNQLVHGNVKVCGVTRTADAQTAKSLGASYLGLIFAPKSKRYVDLQRAKQITLAVPYNYVGVFVDSDVETVSTTATELNLAAVQLHGNENDEYIDKLKQTLPQNCEIWRALGVETDLPIAHIQNPHPHVNKTLLDCKSGNQSGGTGKQFDWHMLDALNDKQTLILAGGINTNNIQTAQQQGVFMLDINSGVESSPGIKDHELLTKAFHQLKA